MKYFKNLFQWLFLGFVFIVLIFLLRGFQPGQANIKLPSEPLTTATPNPYPPPRSTPIPTTTPFTYPICQFPTQIPPEVNPVSNLDQFTFSDPLIVRTNELMFGILDWTPDSRELIYSTLHLERSDATQTIELLNIKGNTSIVYGKAFDFWGFNSYGYAFWIESIQAVAYVQSSISNNYILTISSPYEQKIIPSPIAGANFAKDTDGNLLFIQRDDPSKLMVLDLKNDTQVAIAPELVIPSSDSTLYWQQIKFSSRPKTKQLLLYNDAGTYFLDSQSKQVCEINLGHRGNLKLWAEQIQWSPDGRYFAAVITLGQPTVLFHDFMVFDTWTGKSWTLDLGGKPARAFSWSPNSRNLVVIAGMIRGFTDKFHELYLIDVFTEFSLQMFRDYPFGLGTGSSGVAWSPDGEMIAMDCKKNIPGTAESRGQLCLVKIEGEK